MSCERNETSVSRLWLQQDKVRPKSVLVRGELKWSLVRQQRQELLNSEIRVSDTQSIKATPVV